ncbi:MAG TPA: MATE family efflux transporter [Treponema sp.]|nr:MATE family efflux transporter [Treponema sp.]
MFYTKDKAFFPKLLVLVLPILLQNLLSSSLNFIDVFMIGRLGEASVAAVGSANQFFFILQMLIFGLASSSAIFTAQYWGRGDIKNIRAVMGIGLILTLSISLLVMIVTLFSSHAIIHFFSSDLHVVSLGGDYLRVIAYTFLIVSLTTSFSVVLRSTENVVYPMIASICGIILNTILNYLLIFGNYGFPNLGVLGAAYATLIARFFEMLIIVLITYTRKLPAAASIIDLFNFSKTQVRIYLKKSIPVVLQSAGWAAGFSMFAMIFGHISTESLASYNIAGSIERICLIFFKGLGSACAIMIGNRIGAGEEEKAQGYARNFLILGIIIALVVSSLLLILRRPIVNLYDLTETSKSYMMGILLVTLIILWARACNIIFHMGIFKSGGDTLFSMIVDVGGVWLIGVPIALITAFIFHFPVHYILGFLIIEELVKVLVAFKRYKSGRWVNNLIAKTEKKTIYKQS